MTDVEFDSLADAKKWFNNVIRIGNVKITFYEEWKDGKLKICMSID